MIERVIANHRPLPEIRRAVFWLLFWILGAAVPNPVLMLLFFVTACRLFYSILITDYLARLSIFLS
jgi:hypothetical protein